MALQVVEVKNRSDLKKYIKFPFELYKNDPNWTPPLLRDEYAFYNPGKNKNISSNEDLPMALSNLSR